MKHYFCFLVLIFAGILGFSIAYSAEPQSTTEKVYTRIISLYPAHTENLVQLGAAKSLIGISTSDNYPETILDKPRFHYRDDPEKFIAAHPDLILIRPMIETSYPQFVEKLRQAGITVISLQPNSIEDLYHYWKTLGDLSGRVAKAETMINDFQHQVDQFDHNISLVPNSSRPRVYFESIHRRMKTFAPDSIALFALAKAGGINVASDSTQVRSTTIADYGKERILSKAASIDVYLAQSGRMNPITTKVIKQEPGFAAIKAVRNNEIYLIGEDLISRPTMRILEGIGIIHNFLYPAQVPKK